MEKIVVSTEDELEQVAKEAYFLLRKYSELVDIWRKEYGSHHKNNMEDCRIRVIAFLKDPTKKIIRNQKHEIEYRK